jgi:hypothetical protein
MPAREDLEKKRQAEKQQKEGEKEKDKEKEKESKEKQASARARAGSGGSSSSSGGARKELHLSGAVSRVATDSSWEWRDSEAEDEHSGASSESRVSRGKETKARRTGADSRHKPGSRLEGVTAAASASAAPTATATASVSASVSGSLSGARWDVAHVVRVQALVRRWLARRKLKRLREERARLEALTREIAADPRKLQLLTRLQAMVRGRLARRAFRRRMKRTDIAREILQSERSYVAALRQLVERFLRPLKSHQWVDADVLKTVCGNAEVILAYNEQLLAQLEERMRVYYSSGQRLGDIFVSMVQFLKVYTTYINAYNQAIATFSEAKHASPEFRAFLAQASHEAGGRDLSSFLIMPVQRIPRYVMLLEDLARHTPEGHRDREDVLRARDQVREVADYVNERKKDAENLTQVLAIQERIKEGRPERNFLAAVPHRRYLRQGPLSLLEPRLDRRDDLYAFLFSDVLLLLQPIQHATTRHMRNPSHGTTPPDDSRSCFPRARTRACGIRVPSCVCVWVCGCVVVLTGGTAGAALPPSRPRSSTVGSGSDSRSSCKYLHADSAL